jgi:hypothetical protein
LNQYMTRAYSVPREKRLRAARVPR